MGKVEGKFLIFYVIIGIMFIVMIFISRVVYMKGSTLTGITEAKKFKLTSERSVSVESIFVQPGEAFSPGDTLIILSSKDLNMEYAKLQNQVDKWKTEKIEKSKAISAKIRYLRAQQYQDQNKLETRLDQITAELKLNQMVMDGSSISTDSIVQPKQLMYEALKEQKKLVAQTTSIKIEDITQQNISEQLLIDRQITLADRELNLLNLEQKRMVKIATVSGVVEQVNAKPGESFDSFFTLLSYNPEHPTSIIGFLVGKRVVELKLDQVVEVTSYNHPNIKIQGKVIGFGAVIPLPEILQMSTAVKAFGKEVFINIDEDNKFFVGEKVIIK